MNRMEIDGCDIICLGDLAAALSFRPSFCFCFFFLSITSCLFLVSPLPRVMEHGA